MKKTIFSLLLCAALSIGLIIGSAHLLNGRKNDIALTEEILFGTPAAADGLSITQQHNLTRAASRFSYGGSQSLEHDTIWWDINQTFDNGKCSSDAAFHFTHKRKAPVTEEKDCRLSLFLLGDYQFLHPELFWYSDMLYEALEQNSASYIQQGASPYVADLDLADYYEYLPLCFWLDTPGVTQEVASDSLYPLYRTLNETFRIRVPDDTMVHIFFFLEEDGSISTAQRLLSAQRDVYGRYIDGPLATLSVDVGDGIYFAFSPMVQEIGKRLDISDFRLDYGVYFLPFEADETGNRIPDPSGLRCAIPLAYEAFDELYQLSWNEETDRLYLLTKQHEDIILLCYQKSTATLIDSITLPQMPETIRLEDDHLITAFANGDFSLFAESANGYIEAFTHESIFDDPTRFGYSQTQTRFDGKRLAVISTYCDTAYDSDLCVAVYGADGLQFHAHYTSSLNSNFCSSSVGPPQASWTNTP